jgi:ureidoacrylate peracid hydrolase
MTGRNQPVAHPDGSSSADAAGEIVPLDPARTAVVVVDVQRLFTDMVGAPIAPPLTDVLPAIGRFLADSRRAGVMVALVRTIIPPDAHSSSTLQWPPFMREGMAPGSPGTELDPQLNAQPGGVEIVKTRYSAFFGTRLHELLQQRGIDTVVVLGLTTNVCVQSTARDAWQHDYQTITLEDCCAEIGEGSHVESLRWTARNFGTVLTSHQALRAFERASGGRAAQPI